MWFLYSKSGSWFTWLKLSASVQLRSYQLSHLANCTSLLVILKSHKAAISLLSMNVTVKSISYLLIRPHAVGYGVG